MVGHTQQSVWKFSAFPEHR